MYLNPVDIRHLNAVTDKACMGSPVTEEQDHTLQAGLATAADKLGSSSQQQATMGGEMGQATLPTNLVVGPWKSRLAPC